MDEAKYNGMVMDKIETNGIKRNDIIVLEDGADVKLVQVQEIKKSKPGKHGAAKFNFSGTNLVTKKYYEFTEGSKTQLQICTFVKSPCLLVDVDERKDEFICFNEITSENFSITLGKIPAEPLAKIQKIRDTTPDVSIKFVMVETPYFIEITDIITNSYS
ncbi:hypothetical protein NEDG_00687 [Nematocida displodere]|uniref:Translation initiation factor 5A-like N-terminal domain-containing protein n=1 Tax=Nematocida displodere TaxID=1805483 RepID=A0A177EC77_9MICR|nr:hypothetical protein NEDG_00687 [Nematocida displodere]